MIYIQSASTSEATCTYAFHEAVNTFVHASSDHMHTHSHDTCALPSVASGSDTLFGNQFVSSPSVMSSQEALEQYLAAPSWQAPPSPLRGPGLQKGSHPSGAHASSPALRTSSWCGDAGVTTRTMVAPSSWHSTGPEGVGLLERHAAQGDCIHSASGYPGACSESGFGSGQSTGTVALGSSGVLSGSESD